MNIFKWDHWVQLRQPEDFSRCGPKEDNPFVHEIILIPVTPEELANPVEGGTNGLSYLEAAPDAVLKNQGDYPHEHKHLRATDILDLQEEAKVHEVKLAELLHEWPIRREYPSPPSTPETEEATEDPDSFYTGEAATGEEVVMDSDMEMQGYFSDTSPVITEATLVRGTSSIGDDDDHHTAVESDSDVDEAKSDDDFAMDVDEDNDSGDEYAPGKSIPLTRVPFDDDSYIRACA